MEIVPMRIFWMTVASLVFGLSAGVVNDINRLIRVFFGVKYNKKGFERLKSIRLPIIKKELGEIKEGRAIKIILPVIMFFQDIAFFFYAGVGVAILNYYFNNGRVRIYAPVAVVIGFILYYFTIGRAVLYFSEAISFLARAFFVILFETICRPIRKIVTFFGKIAKKIHININKTIAKKQKMVYNNNKKDFVMKGAAFGFLELTNNKRGGP